MKLTGLLPLIEDVLGKERLARLLESTGERRIVAAAEGAWACLVAVLSRHVGAPLLVVTSRPNTAWALAEELNTWLGDEEKVLLFPRRDTLPYERLAPDWPAIRDRLLVLSALAERPSSRLIIVTSVQAVSQTTLLPEELRSARETIVTNGTLSPEPFLRRLSRRGYRFEPLVDAPGLASRRGGIVDVFSPDADLPVRIELLGDRVESLRLFDPATQRTVRLVDSVTLGPAREMLLPQPRARELLSRLDFTHTEEEVERRFREELAMLAEGEGFDDDSFYLPFLARATLLDHLPQERGASLLVLDELPELGATQEEHDRQVAEVRDDMAGRGELPRNMPLPNLSWTGLRESLAGRPDALVLSRWAGGEDDERSLRLPCAAPKSYGGRLQELAKDLAEASRRGETAVIGGARRDRRAGALTGRAAARGVALAGARVAPAGMGAPARRSCAHASHRRRDLRLREAAPARPSAFSINRALPVRPAAG